jgi:hypothetical protein
MSLVFPYEEVLQGKGEAISFPEDPFARWEIVHQFPGRCDTPEKARVAFIWFIEKSPIEWTQFFLSNLLLHVRPTGNLSLFSRTFRRDPRIWQFISEYIQIIKM